ncbi:hypothetical protein EX30DRAFT_364146 [Ascodesmis nigricans]|uniref:Uncharacterized protein n=1 Tax=Ascodesmis nigricans TaxID=341454 RepID=A0A4S2MWV6_9PEZI|nr:hypothetical protein EX30DRAFT_364146 [Ascodesmis nigricans]
MFPPIAVRPETYIPSTILCISVDFRLEILQQIALCVGYPVSYSETQTELCQAIYSVLTSMPFIKGSLYKTPFLRPFWWINDQQENRFVNKYINIENDQVLLVNAFIQPSTETVVPMAPGQGIITPQWHTPMTQHGNWAAAGINDTVPMAPGQDMITPQWYTPMQRHGNWVDHSINNAVPMAPGREKITPTWYPAVINTRPGLQHA